MAKKKKISTVAEFTPSFCHRSAIEDGYRQLFEVFQMPDPAMRRALFASILVENSVTLLSGTYGTGKTQLVQLIKSIFFRDGNGGHMFDYETCHQELTAFDVLYHLDLAELQQGNEIVHPKKMVTARLKFLNEIQRANTGFFNVLLPLLSEHRITYRDFELDVPDFICIMDRNPLDAGSSEIPEAFLDRIDFSFEIPAIHLAEHRTLQTLRNRGEGVHWGDLDQLVDSSFTFAQLEEVWEDIKKVNIPQRAVMLSGMISDAMRLCIVCERSNARLEFDLNCPECQFQGEICSHLLKVPGQRINNSLLRLAQALAWLDGDTEVTSQHLLAALPWCMHHRLALRPEELRKKPNAQDWVRETAIMEILQPKLSLWERSIEAFEIRNVEFLMEHIDNDLVIRQLAIMLTEGVSNSPNSNEFSS